MTPRTEAGALLLRFAQRIDAGDLDGALDLFAPDVLARAPGPAPHIEPEYRGRDALRRYFDAAGRIWAGGTQAFRVEALAEDGEVAYATYAVTATDARGRQRTFRGVKVVRAKGGRIVELDQFYDTLAVAEAALASNAPPLP